jgi:hypothetical protein
MPALRSPAATETPAGAIPGRRVGCDLAALAQRMKIARRMMIGIGTPTSQRRIERPMTMLLCFGDLNYR